MEKKPSILIVAPYGFNDRLTNFIEFVTGRLLARSGWAVHAVTRQEKGEPLSAIVEGIHVERYASIRRGIFQLLALCVRTHPDIIHIHNLRNNQIGCIAAMYAKLFRIPLFFTEYGLPHDHYLSADRDDPFSAPLEYGNVISSLGMLVRRCLRNPMRTNDFLRNYLFHYPLFAARTVVFVSKHNIPIARKLGIKDARYIPQIADSVRWNVPNSHEDELLHARVRALPKGMKTLFVGQFKERKGWKTYLEAIARIPDDTISTFILVTPSSDKSEFDPLVDKLKVKHRIALFEKIPGSILKELYAAADMVVVPSLYEGFGLVPLEAFESGKPVIASRVEALTDFLSDNNTLLIPPNDPQALAGAIQKFVSDRELRDSIARGGSRTLAGMRSEEVHRQWLDLYRESLHS